MSPLLRLLTRIGAVLLLLVVGALAALAVRAHQARSAVHPVAPVPLSVLPDDPEAIAEGGRLARVLGCYGGCHGQRLEGAPMVDDRVALLIAPNLSRVIPSYDDAELARAIRHGLRRDGTALFGMPTASLFHLSDADLGRLIAFLRRQPREDGDERATQIGAAGYLALATGSLRPVAATLDHGATRVSSDAGTTDAAERGRYVATVACGECHGVDLQGGRSGPAVAPPLAVAAAYTDAALAHLLRTGETPGRRDLAVMDDVARQRLRYLTDDEIAAISAFVRR